MSTALPFGIRARGALFYSLQNSTVFPTQTPLGRTPTLSGGSRYRSRPAAIPNAATLDHIVWVRLKQAR